MSVDPTRHLTSGGDGVHRPRFQCQSVNGSEPLLPLFGVTQTADEIDCAFAERRRMEISGRKPLARIAENLEVALAVVDYDVVVNVEVRIVVVLVLACDLDESPVAERCQR